jgi:hypothetical protein
VPSGEVKRFSPGDSFVLRLRDSTRVAGKYLGPAEVSDHEYRARYQEWLVTSPAAEGMPHIGDRVSARVQQALSFSSEGNLVAFEHDGVVIQDSPWPAKRWTYKQINQFTIMRRGQISGERLLAMRLDGDLPLTTALKMETSTGLRTIMLDEVQLVEMRSPGHGSRNGFLVGLAIDVIVVALAAEIYGACSSISASTLQTPARTRMRFLTETYLAIDNPGVASTGTVAQRR